MSSTLTKNKKATTIVLVFFFSLFGIQSSHADYYPTGIQQNVSEQTLIDNGWKVFYQEYYGTTIGTSGSQLRPRGKYTILTGKAVDSSILPLLAAAPTSDVFTETVRNIPHFSNGTYWYNTPARSMGFAPTNIIEQDNADCYEAENLNCTGVGVSPLRLSWHLDNQGGWRLGDVTWLNESTTYLKQVWTWNGPTAQALRQTSNLSFDQSQYGSDTLSDPDGQLRKTIDSINAKYGSLIK